MVDAGVVQRVFAEAAPAAYQYVDILASRGVDWGLIGPREVPRLWERHVLNSASIADLLPRDARICDVGSGAGLPGIPLALARPDVEIVLLEPLLRRVNFLEQTVDELGLGDRVTVERGRAEDHHQAYDVVTSRAVAAVSKFVPWVAHLVPEGEIVALKGESVQQEIDAAAKVLKKYRLSPTVRSVRADVQTEPTTALVLTHL